MTYPGAELEDIEAFERNKDVPALMRSLRSSDWMCRSRAADALGRLADPRAANAMVKALSDENDSVRRAAALYLGEIKFAKAVEPLLKALHDTEAGVWGAAAIALGELGDTKAVRRIVPLLESPSVDTRRAAAFALGNIGDPNAVLPLTRILDDPNEYVRSEAGDALVRIGDPTGLTALIEMLHNDDGRIRETAAKSIRSESFNDPRAVEPLVGLLADENGARYWAILALGKLGDPRAVTPLLELLARPDVGTLDLTHTVEALGKLGDPRCVERIIPMLEHGEDSIREAAAFALARVGDERCVAPLISALKDRRSAPWAVEPGRLFPAQEAAAKALVQIGQASIEPLEAEYRTTEDPYLKKGIAEALSQITGDKELGEAAPVLRFYCVHCGTETDPGGLIHFGGAKYVQCMREECVGTDMDTNGRLTLLSSYSDEQLDRGRVPEGY